MTSLHEEKILEESIDTDEDETGKEEYGVRDVTLFLIDASPPMFDNTNEQGEPYFLESLTTYTEILSKKLLWNRSDWTGLMLFNTEQWDTNPEIKNVLTLQKLSIITIDQLIKAREAVQKWESYKAISSSTQCPLRELFWHITLCFSQIKVAMPMRRVILFTCQDDPPGLDANDKHAIRERAAAFNDIDVQLFVIGLGPKWNHDIFYKDLEMLSRNIKKDDYDRISNKDLMQQIRLPSHVIAKLLWRIGKDVKINVQISNVCAKSKTLEKMNLCAETNEPLVLYTYERPVETDMNEENNDEEELMLETKKKFIQKLGGETICFTPKELRNLRNISNVGMDMICVKPLNCDPMYHVRAPYFVRCNKRCSKDEKFLFGAILNQCNKKGLMIVSALTPRETSSTHLYNMIPSMKDGGFYLHKIPYENEVKNLEECLSEFSYNSSDKEAPINEQMVALFQKLIKKAKIRYDPDYFPNPRLQRQLQYVETIALELEPPTPSVDQAVCMSEDLTIRVKEYVKQINELNEQITSDDETIPVQKRKQERVFDNRNIQELVKRRKVETCTVPELRNFLKEAGITTAGKKAELIEKIYEHFSDSSLT